MNILITTILVLRTSQLSGFCAQDVFGLRRLRKMTRREKYNLKQFSGENFNAWEFRIRSILRDDGVIKAIADDKFNIDPENEERENIAQAIIIAGVADTHLEYLKAKKSAYDMFKNLENNFKSRGAGSRLFVRRKLNKMKYN